MRRLYHQAKTGRLKEALFVIIPRMNESELTRKIIDTLGKSGDVNDLLLEICETTGMPWTQAEALVDRVRAENSHVVAGRQLPIMVIIALGIFLGGLGFIGLGTYLIVTEISIIQANLQAAQLANLDGIQQLMVSSRMILETGFTPITMIITGIAMLIGSLAGMRKTWASILLRD